MAALDVGPNVRMVWVMPRSVSPSDSFVGMSGCLRWQAPINTSSYFGILVSAGQQSVALVLVNTEPTESPVYLELQAVESGEPAPC